MYNDEDMNGYDNNSSGTDNSNNNDYNDSGNNYNNSSYDNSNYNNNYNNSNYGSYNNNNGYNYNNGNSDDNKNGKKKKAHRNAMIITVVVAVGVFIFGAIATALIIRDDIGSDPLKNYISNNAKSEKNEEKETAYDDIGSTNITKVPNTSLGSVVVTDVSSVVEGAMPSVVAITSTTLVEAGDNYFDSFWDDYFGGDSRGNNNRQYETEAAGSGIIIDQTDTELLIVTNNHVVEGSDSLKIQFYGDENTNVDAYIKGTDPNADVAVVAVNLKDIPADTLKVIKKAAIGDSEDVKVGEGVVAIGNALGYGQSVTTGVISAKDREVTIDKKTMTLMQTDAAINGGNSGGALLNARGEVIGINVAKYSSNGTMSGASVEGMGFAIPISSVKNIISNLETRETRTKAEEAERGYLGIRGNDVTDEVSQQYGVPKGVYIFSVTNKGPADKAGIMAQDVITKFDGQIVSSMAELQNLMAYYKAGEKVKVSVSYRSGRVYEEKEVEVTLADQKTISSLDSEDLQN